MAAADAEKFQVDEDLAAVISPGPDITLGGDGP
jgi:hypothetical protein